MKGGFIISKTKRQVIKLLSLAVLSLSCSHNELIDEGKLYRKDVEMNVDGTPAKGVHVAPRQQIYKITFNLPDKPNIVKLTTCHREVVFKDPGKKLEYEYKPVHGLEDKGSCILEIGAFDEEGYHLWGMIDFETDEEMVGIVGCNGESKAFRGASVCQSKAGLIQKIYFPKEVAAVTTENCPPMESKDKHTFLYTIAQNKCIYLFSDGTYQHRLTTFGYDEVLIR